MHNTVGDVAQKCHLEYKCIPNKYSLLFAGTHRGSDFITTPASVKNKFWFVWYFNMGTYLHAIKK